jgi:hypothetical protein
LKTEILSVKLPLHEAAMIRRQAANRQDDGNQLNKPGNTSQNHPELRANMIEIPLVRYVRQDDLRRGGEIGRELQRAADGRGCSSKGSITM